MKTAVQEVFSELEKLHPQLFNVYTQEGRDFLNHFHKFLEIEKQQIIKAVYDSMGTNIDPNMGRAEQYYNEIYKNK
jgi:hypothetical protein